MKRIFLVLAISSSVSIAQAQTPFPDVPPNHWAANAIAKLVEAGIIVGYPADEKPTRTISSAPQKIGKISKAVVKKYAGKTR